jgi:hypothetical protein
MLWDVDNKCRIDGTPHHETWKVIVKRLQPDGRLQLIKELLNTMIDSGEIHTTSWMPGADWRDTPFQAIYEIAARGSEELAGKMFGLICWHVFQERSEKWAFGRYDKDGVPIGGMTYFIVD